MELILKQTIETLGEEGDIVKVKPGYARNYLIPHNKAVIANKGNIAILEREKATIEARKEAQRKGSVDLASKINGTVVTIEQRVGEENRLFGSVTTADIAAKLTELGIKVDKKKILLDEPIKTLGETLVQIKIGYQVNAEVKIEIVPLASE